MIGNLQVVRPCGASMSWVHAIADHRFLEAMTVMVERHCKGVTLDVGCGQGRYHAVIRQHARWLVPVDLPVTSSGVPRALVFMSGEALAIGADSIDTIVSTHVIEHVPDTTRYLEEMHRVLHIGGKAILAYSHISHLNEAPHDFHRFTRHFFDRCVPHGLAAIDHVYCGDLIALTGTALCALVDKCPIRMIARLLMASINRVALALDRRFPGRGNYALGGVVVLEKRA